MDDRLKAHLDQITKDTQKFNAEADQASRDLKEVSDQLAEHGPGIPIYLDVEVDPEDPEGPDRSPYTIYREPHIGFAYAYFLGYDRYPDSSAWGMVAKREVWGAPFGNVPPDKIIPIASTSRIIRIRAARRLPEFVDRMAEVVSDLIRKIDGDE